MSESIAIATEPMENRQVRLSVTVPAEIVDPILHKTARRLASQVRVPGFRPGKAPLQIIERRIGREALIQESLETIVDIVYEDAVEKAALEPSGPPSLEDFAADPLSLTFVVPLQPVVELGDYSSLRVDYETPSVEPEAVDKQIQELRERHTTWAPVERPAEFGDLVTVDIEGHVAEPTVIDEDSLVAQETVIDQENWDMELSEAGEGLIPGLDAAFVGLSAGESKSFELTYPEDSTSQWAGRTAQFQTTVHVVKATSVPDDDELAQEVGDFADMAALRAQIAENLLEEATEAAVRAHRTQVLDALLEQARQIEFPPAMLERELDATVGDQESYYRSMGIDMQTYLRLTNQTAESFREGLRTVAERRLKQRLALLDVARQENVHVHRSDIEAEIEETAGAMTAENAGQFRDMMHSAGGQQYVAENLVWRRALERLVALAKGTPLPPEVHDHDHEHESAVAGEAESVADEAEAAPESAADDAEAAPAAEPETPA